MYGFLPFWIRHGEDIPEICFLISGFEEISQGMKRYPMNIFHVQGYLDLSVDVTSMAIHGLSNVLFCQSTAPLDAKCSTFEVLDLLGSGLMETRSVVKLYYRKEQLGLSLRFAELE